MEAGLPRRDHREAKVTRRRFRLPDGPPWRFSRRGNSQKQTDKLRKQPTLAWCWLSAFAVADVAAFVKEDDFFGDVFAVVGDALEAFGNHHQAQAAGDVGGVFHHEARQLAVELLVQGIDFLVAWNDSAGLFGIAIHE